MDLKNIFTYPPPYAGSLYNNNENTKKGLKICKKLLKENYMTPIRQKKSASIEILVMNRTFIFIRSAFRKRTGEFFLYGYGNDLSKYGLAEVNGIEGSVEVIIPFTDEEAKDWTERYSDAHTYIELFGVPEE